MAIKYTEEQLNSVDKSMLIQMFLNQQEQLEKVSANLHSLDTKMQAMMEQLIIGNKNRFGRSSEKMEDTQQMCFIEVDGTLVFFNEAEAVCDLDAPEPETLEATPERKKKTKGKKAQDMSELSTNRIDHYIRRICYVLCFIIYQRIDSCQSCRTGLDKVFSLVIYTEVRTCLLEV